jgi:hypothetical protein
VPMGIAIASLGYALWSERRQQASHEEDSAEPDSIELAKQAKSELPRAA